MIRQAAFLVTMLTFLASATSAVANDDPLDSAVWQDLLETEFAGAEVVYDDSLYLVAPASVEEAFSVPIVMNFADTPYEIVEIALFAEHNPFPTVARIYPQRRLDAVGFDIRLEQTTPLRAAVMDAQGTWHVVQQMVEVLTPGGCSSGGGGGGMALGDIVMRQFVRADGDSRLKVKVGHPMHTGLVIDPAGDVIPSHYIDQIFIEDESGPLAKMLLWASVAANPVFLFDLPTTQQTVRVQAYDTGGQTFEIDSRPASM